VSGRGRTEAFSDGIFAVAATLLVLDLKVPEVSSDLLGALLRQWPAYAAYAVSFLTIGIIWVNHHAVFDRLRSVDRPLQFLNLLLLMSVAAIPFTTSLLSTYLQAGHQDRVAAAAYGAVMTVMGIFFASISLYIGRHGHLLGDPTRHSRASQLRFMLPGAPVYAAAILLSLLDARLALLVYFLLAVFYAFLPVLER
jgi:uncharacterized membrane protein